MFGVISYVHPQKPFGFLRPNGGRGDIFFGRDALIDFVFSDALKGERVEFDLIETDRGPAARNVRPVNFDAHF
jgi:CspA family cold shock protein